MSTPDMTPGTPVDEPSVRPLIITLDGPAGSGKSTVARQLAQRLGVDFLDTGAMYRGLAVLCLDRHIDPVNDARAMEDLASRTTMRFDWQQDPPELWVNDQNVTRRIRDQDVTASVSEVAANSQVRKLMVQWQREIAQAHPRLVTEGRDQGSVVFPDAQVRFYLVASAQVRARRRTRELIAAGKSAVLEKILEEIQRRDQRDMSRQDSPLVKPAGALEVDTSELTLREVVDRLDQLIKEHVPPANLAPPPEHTPDLTPEHPRNNQPDSHRQRSDKEQQS